MTDADGSSGAAQGAPETDRSHPRGLFSRLWGQVSAGDDADDDHGSGEGRTANGYARPGLSNLRRMQIADVAIPKGEIAAVPVETDLPSLVATFRDSGFTRLPVFEGTLDTPLGMVHLKDVALDYGFDCDDRDFDMKALVRPLIYAPPSMPIGILLQKMQSERMHMALVIDEYGGTDGLVTIEDLIEQVIGEIEDEHDVDEDQLWTLERPGVYVALARAPLDEFEDEVGIDLSIPDSDDLADTLGGVVFLLTGRVPARGEIVKHPAGVEIEVVDADPRRIKRLRIQVPNDPAAGGAA
ncbi:hemolysin family protein [Meridianimarinicoccus sp. RP-17]|uniref:hemolysin family protein n=1 Tax=Meridianimarinicoccus zhengii TaxID=2056810 RepID=UPI000DAEE10E|nr:hemolysin family protein [Phycocomes zhengii]